MDPTKILEISEKLNQEINTAAQTSATIQEMSKALTTAQGTDLVSPFISGLGIFILAVFVGYYVVWRVTPALHSPLMAVTNAISSVIIVGALVAAGGAMSPCGSWMGFLGVVLAAINIFGGFVVTQRMLHMFTANKSKKK
jgi:NAD(P) transhydrogenase subunit alpha